MFPVYIYYEIKKRLQNKSLVIAEIVIALLLIAGLFPLSAVIVQETSRVARFSVAIADEEQSLYTQIFMSRILTSPSIQDNLDVVLTDRAEALNLINKNEIAGIIIIPATFTKNMQEGIFTPLELYLNPNMPLQARLIEEGMRSGAYLMSTVQNALFTVYSYYEQMPISDEELDMLFQTEMLVLISEALDRNQIYGRHGKTPWADLTMTEYYIFSIPMLLISLFGCGSIIGFRDDEKNNVVGRLVLAGKSRFQISLYSTAASTLILFIQCTLITLPFCIFGGILPYEKYFSLLPLIFLISLQINLLNMIFAVLIKNPLSACMTSIILSLLQALLSGTLIPFYFLPSFFPEQLRFFTLNFWWQHSFVSIYTSGNLEGLATALLIICAMTCILRGAIYAKFESIYLYNTKRV